MGLQIIKLVLPPGRSVQCPSNDFFLGGARRGVILEDVCLFLLSFSEKHLGKHTVDTDKILLL